MKPSFPILPESGLNIQSNIGGIRDEKYLPAFNKCV